MNFADQDLDRPRIWAGEGPGALVGAPGYAGRRDYGRRTQRRHLARLLTDDRDGEVESARVAEFAGDGQDRASVAKSLGCADLGLCDLRAAAGWVAGPYSRTGCEEGRERFGARVS